MATVWKFPLASLLQDIEVPVGARFIKVDVQRKQIFLWAWCDPGPDVPKEVRWINVVGTGYPAPNFGAAEHVGTVIENGGGDFVWHVFELKRPPS